MPEIGGVHDGRQILVPVILIGPGQSQPSMVETAAILDTGATSSTISPRIADELRLQPRGRRIMNTAAGSRRATIYGFTIAFGSDCVIDNGGLPGTGPLYFPRELIGTDFTPGHHYEVLLGMDVISHGDLIIRRNARWSFSF